MVLKLALNEIFPMIELFNTKQEAPNKLSQKKGKITLRFGQIIITIGLIAFSISRLREDLVSIQIRLVQPMYLILAAVLVVFGILLSTRLWALFIQPIHILPFRDLLSDYLNSVLWNVFLPSGLGGDAVRGLSLHQRIKDTGTTVNSLLMSRLVGLWSIVVMSAGSSLLFTLIYGPDSGLLFLITSLCVLVITIIGSLFLLSSPKKPLLRRLPKIVRKWHTKLQNYGHNPFLLTKAFGYATGIQILAIGINFTTSKALNLEISLWQLWLSLPIITLVTMLPISIGGFGLRESAYVVLLGQLGVAAVDGLVLSLAVYTLLLFITAVGAGISLIALSSTEVKSQQGQKFSKSRTPGIKRANRLIKQVLKPSSPPETPTDLIFFITDRCNARCKHCFYRYALDAKDQNDPLSLHQIEDVFSSLRTPLKSLVLTGGEPFLHSDLPEICKLAKIHTDPKLLVIPTNGILTDQIVFQVEQICKLNFPSLLIQISLDGLEDTHDNIRNFIGCFTHAVNTAKALRLSQKDYPNLEVAIMTTISRQNIHELEALADFVHDVIKLPHSFEVIRDSRNRNLTSLPLDLASNAHPHDPSSQRLSIEELSDLLPRLAEIYRKNTHLVTGNHPLWTPLAIAFRQGRFQHLVDVLKNQRPFKCPAGKETGVIYPNGEVALCELSKPIGKLENYDFDFYELWTSEKAQNMRDRLSNCYCTHGCFQTVAMMHEPLMVARMGMSAINNFIRGYK